MIDIFISYRHDVSEGAVRAIWTHLVREFGEAHVFLDTNGPVPPIGSRPQYSVTSLVAPLY